MSAKTDCRQCRKLRRSLLKMTDYVRAFLGALDDEMKSPSSLNRGGRVALLSNKLDIANDSIRYFELGIDYRKDRKPRVPESVLDVEAGK